LILTGLGLPSQMGVYTGNDNVKAFELWNPADLGYLAGWTAIDLATGATKNTVGSTITIPSSAPQLKEAKSWTITKAIAGSGDPSNFITLGAPFVFTKANVKDFNF